MNKTHITITEDMIRDAAKAYGEAVLASRAEDIKEHNTKRSASRIINHQRVVFRLAVCILAIIILIGGVFTIDASARERFVNWVRSIFDNRVEYRFVGEPPVQYDPLFPADFSLSSPDNVVCTVDTDTRKEYSIDVGSDRYSLIYMLSTEHDFSSEIGSEYTVSEAWINGLEGKYYKALQENVPDIMIWHDAYDIVYILESSAGQEAMQAFAENIRLDYYLDHAVCYNGAISYSDFSLIEDEYEIECVDDEIWNKTYMIYDQNGGFAGVYSFNLVSEDEVLVIENDIDKGYEYKELLIYGYKGEYVHCIDDDYNNLIWLDQGSGIIYELQMNKDLSEQLRLIESIRYIQ